MTAFFIVVFTVLAGTIGFLAFRIGSLRKALHKAEDENRTLCFENAKLNNLSMTDTLTGLMNRRAIEPIILNAMHRRNRFNTPVSLLILDLDHFKRINDSYGHDYGDKVLQSIGGIIKKICRKTDNFARWGGEEFLVLATDTNAVNALVLAEKIRNHIETSDLEELSDVTVSIGISSYRKSEDFREWFNRADNALYHAKDSGRNLAVLSPDDMDQVDFSNPDPGNALRMEWKHQYSAGIDDIDIRHQELFQQSNRVVDSVLKQSDSQYLESAMDEMLERVIEHFRAEEQILNSMNYQGLDTHVSEHNRLISQFKGLIDLFHQKEVDPIMLLNYISQELIYEHLILKDSEYSHLNKRNKV